MFQGKTVKHLCRICTETIDILSINGNTFLIYTLSYRCFKSHLSTMRFKAFHRPRDIREKMDAVFFPYGKRYRIQIFLYTIFAI